MRYCDECGAELRYTGNNEWECLECDAVYKTTELKDREYYEEKITEFYILKWNYKRGIIKTSVNEIIVTPNGDIKYLKEILFEKSESDIVDVDLSDKDIKIGISNGNLVYETKLSALKLSDLKLSINSTYTVCEGKITNEGDCEYTSVKVNGCFKDSNGDVVDVNSIYAVGEEGLAPGETKIFKIMILKNNNVTTCDVDIV